VKKSAAEAPRGHGARVFCVPSLTPRNAPLPTLQSRRLDARLSELSSPDHLPYWNTPYAPIALQCGGNTLDSTTKDVKIAFENSGPGRGSLSGERQKR
jgi:hypothetical protein